MHADAAELELFRDNVKRFLAKEIAPHYEKWEKESWMPRPGSSWVKTACWR